MNDSDSAAARSPLWLCGAIAWLVVFAGLFWTSQLPNNGGLSRTVVWQNVPFQLLDLVDPPREPNSPPAGLRFLPQRLDLFLVAGFIWVGVWSLGSLLLRFGRLDGFDDGATRSAFAGGLGLSVWSLLVLGFGLAGLLSQWLFVGLLAAFVISESVCWRRSPSRKAVEKPQSIKVSKRSRRKPKESQPVPSTDPWPWMALAVVAPFLCATLLGAALPSTDFDAKAYHLLGPKEFFQQGRVGFLSHNVYTSFPFLTEMLTLSGMVVRGDWFRGALVGKLVLAGFGPLTALAIFAAGRRWFGSTAAWLAVIVHLTTPWTFRISTIAYAEGGLSAYLFLSLFAGLLTVERLRSGGDAIGLALLAGLMAGSAMACKYPALLTVVGPVAVLLTIVSASSWRQPTVHVAEGEATRPGTNEGAMPNDVSPEQGADAPRSPVWVLIAFGLGTLITIGPWLLKNVVETGNPVYPLAYSIFGGFDLDEELAAKWVAGHSPDHHDPLHLLRSVVDVSVWNDWLSPLLCAFAPLSLVVLTRRTGSAGLEIEQARRSHPAGPVVAITAAFVLVNFLAWWVFTHRIDRFWVPMLPAVALLAGVGATWSEVRPWRWTVGVFITLASVYNLVFVTSGLSGYNQFQLDLDSARTATARLTAPTVAGTNELVPPDATVLCVGEGQLFDATFRPIYHTVFDRCLLEEWMSGQSDDEVRRRFRDEGVQFVLVNWREILRYRTTYGYTDFVTPERFDRLREVGLLGEPLISVSGTVSEGDAAHVREWAPSLLDASETAMTNWQLFPVREESRR